MTCETCPYFHKAIQSECRRKAPTPFAIVAQTGVMIVGGYPPTRPDAWCGEHPKRVAASAGADAGYFGPG